jgi:hypothetical protein
MTTWIVRHKNPTILGENEWATDGEGLNWSKLDAEAHAERCEYAKQGITFEIVPAKGPKTRFKSGASA